MTAIRSFLLSVCGLLFLPLTARVPSHFYMMHLKMPATCTSLPGLKGHYKGHTVDASQGWALIPEERECFTFSLIITPDFDEIAEGNQIRCLKRREGLPCKWFDITLCKEEMGRSVPHYTWKIELRNDKEVPLRMPTQALVVKMNPEHVERLEAYHYHLRGKVVHLPTLILQANLTEREWQEQIEPIILSLTSAISHRAHTCEMISPTEHNTADNSAVPSAHYVIVPPLQPGL
jgi:hypothetical protein